MRSAQRPPQVIDSHERIPPLFVIALTHYQLGTTVEWLASDQLAQFAVTRLITTGTREAWTMELYGRAGRGRYDN